MIILWMNPGSGLCAGSRKGWIGGFVEVGARSRKSSSKGDKLHAQVEMHGAGSQRKHVKIPEKSNERGMVSGFSS